MAEFIIIVIIGSFVLTFIIGIGRAVNEAMFDPSKTGLPCNMKIIRRDEYGKLHYSDIIFNRLHMCVDGHEIKYSDITSAKVYTEEKVKRPPSNYYLSVKARTYYIYSLLIQTKNGSEHFFNFANVTGYNNVAKMIDYMKEG